jgi:hypothetical protein
MPGQQVFEAVVPFQYTSLTSNISTNVGYSLLKRHLRAQRRKITVEIQGILLRHQSIRVQLVCLVKREQTINITVYDRSEALFWSHILDLRYESNAGSPYLGYSSLQLRMQPTRHVLTLLPPRI